VKRRRCRPPQTLQPLLDYDENQVTLRRSRHVSFTEDVGERFAGTAGRCCTLRTRMIWKWLAKAYDGFLHTADRPTLIRVNSHIGLRISHKQDTTPLTANPSAMRKSGW